MTTGLGSSPSNSAATAPARDLAMRKTVPSEVTTTHNQALRPPSRQPVSSMFAASAAFTDSASSATGPSSTSAVIRSSLEIMPTEIDRPSRSEPSCATCRLLSRYAPVSTLSTACSRGPNAVRGTPAGNAPQVIALQCGQHSRWSRYSWTSGSIGGNSATW